MEHEWIVFSTAVGVGCLMLRCQQCEAFGTIDDPTLDEWKTAFYAPSNPYRWSDNKRVNIREGSVECDEDLS